MLAAGKRVLHGGVAEGLSFCLLWLRLGRSGRQGRTLGRRRGGGRDELPGGPGQNCAADEQVVGAAVFGDCAHDGPFELRRIIGDLGDDTLQIEVFQGHVPGIPLAAEEHDAVVERTEVAAGIL